MLAARRVLTLLPGLYVALGGEYNTAFTNGHPSTGWTGDCSDVPGGTGYLNHAYMVGTGNPVKCQWTAPSSSSPYVATITKFAGRGVTLTRANTHSDGTAGASSTTITLPAVTGGDTLICTVQSYSGTGVTSITGAGVTWVKASSEPAPTVIATTEVWYALNAPVSASTVTVTVTLAGSGSGNISTWLTEWARITGFASSAGVDNITGANPTTPTLA